MRKFSAISRVLAFLLVVCLCSAFVPVMTFAEEVTPGTATEVSSDFWDGTATAAENLNIDDDAKIIYIDTAEDLAGLSALVGNGADWAATEYPTYTILLTKDLIMNEDHENYLDWTSSTEGLKRLAAIGSYSYNYGFSGTFDGQGHTIYGLATDTTNGYGGLFGYIGAKSTAVIKNVAVVNSFFSGGSAAGILGRMNGGANVTIENCYTNAKVQATHTVGGVVGSIWVDGASCLTVKNCVFAGTVKNTTAMGQTNGAGFSGGILGGFGGGAKGATLSITNCLNLGNITGTGLAGGILGGVIRWQQKLPIDAVPEIKNCINLGSVAGDKESGEIYGSLACHGTGDPDITYLSDAEIRNNIYDSSKNSDADDSVTAADIKGMSVEDLAASGFTAWSVGSVAGQTCPVPTAASTVASATLSPDADKWDGTTVDTEFDQDENGNYLITSAAELVGLAQIVDLGDMCDNETYLLTTDIIWNEGDASTWTASTTGLNKWNGIGNSGSGTVAGTEDAVSGYKYFRGSINGQGHVISGLWCTDMYAGLIAATSGAGNNQVIENLSIVNSAFIGNIARGGGVFAFLNGNSVDTTIRNVYVDLRIESTYNTGNGIGWGGIVGGLWVDGSPKLTVENCVFNGSISATKGGWAGGIIGFYGAQDSVLNVNNCLVIADLNGGTKHAGGILGALQPWTGKTPADPAITNCIAMVTATATSGLANNICGSFALNSGVAARTGITNVLYDNDEYISVNSLNVGKTVSEIKAMDDASLTEAGYTAWTTAEVNGEVLPVPAAVVDLIPEPELVVVDAIINATVSGKDATVQLFNGDALVEEKVSENGAVSFTVAGLTEGTYTYTLKQNAENGAGWTYDASVKEVTVVVDAEGNVSVTEGITFTNTYAAAGTFATINVDVNVAGKEFNADDFTLLVNGVETTIVDGKATLNYTYDAEGEIAYVIELVSKNAGITIAEAAKTVTVTVTDDKNGQLVATGVEDVTFDAAYTAAGTSATIGANVTLNGEVSDREFVILVDGEEVAVVDGKISLTKEYTEAGTYYYTLTQKNTELGGVTYDNATYVITVTVTDNGEGQLVATVGENNPTFANTYKPEAAKVNVDSVVSLTGKTLEEGMFTFVLYDAEGNPLQTVTNAADGTVDFEFLVFETAGNYNYTLKQLVGDVAGITYDEVVYSINVEVSDFTDYGVLVALTTIYAGDENVTKISFTNTYDYVVDTDVIINVNVSVTDKTLAEGDVTATLLKGEEIIATGMIDAEGKISFTIDASKDMAGDYTIALSTEVAGITLPEAQTVIVTVEDDGDGVANVTATNTDLTFHGSYRVPFAAGEIIDGKYVVTETGKATEMGLIKIGDDYYYAGPNGVLVTNQKYYTWRLNENCDIEKGWYYFDAEGKLVDTGIVDGYYYENGEPTEKGLIKIGEDYYYAGPNGKLVVNQRYYAWKVDTNCDLTTAYYRFDETGKMIGSSSEGEIVEVNGQKYYYRSGKPTEMGLFEYEGNYYVAQYDGMIITSENYTKYGAGKYYVWKADGVELEKGYWRYFDTEGKMIGASSEGEIVTINGVKYYFVNGAAKEVGLFEYEGNYYVAQYNGKIVTDKKYYVWKVDSSASEIGTGWFNFGADGKLVK